MLSGRGRSSEGFKQTFFADAEGGGCGPGVAGADNGLGEPLLRVCGRFVECCGGLPGGCVSGVRRVNVVLGDHRLDGSGGE
jgi:hypothetical protein